MTFTLLDLCRRTDTDYALIRRRTDACAQLGRSYELHCALPAHCTPSDAAIGFWRTAGRYCLYIRPKIHCSNSAPTLSKLITHETVAFSSFSELTAYLRCLGRELSNIDHSTPPLYHNLRDALSHYVLCQPDAVEAASFRIAAHLCKTTPLRPLSLILYGPTGVGKSELGKSIAPILRSLQPQRNWNCVWTDLNTFTQPHSLYRLIGAPPGYIGYGDPPIFDTVRRNPYTVFMFDELDKAHPEILKVFMSILDEGRCCAHCQDERGQRELDFRHCIFIFTTNADLTDKSRKSIGFQSTTCCTTSLESESEHTDLAQRLFRQDETARRAMVRHGTLCEIAARFTALIGFHPLDNEARRAITVKQIVALAREFGLQILSVSPTIAAELTPQGAFSVRSTTAVLEAHLTALFAAHAVSHRTKLVHLCGTLQNMKLLT